MKRSFLTHDVYFYVDADGKRNFPTADAVRQDAERGIHTILVLDANVCLELAKYAQGEKDAKKDSDARHFLLSVELAKLDVAPLLGCMELAAHKNRESIDLTKFSQLATNVNRALNQTEWSLAHGHLPGTGQIFELEQNPELTSFYPLLRYFYCAFLKIAQVRARGSLQGRAINNYIEFFDWCEQMECHVGILSQAAALIFGGSHHVDSLIKVTKKKGILDSCWGAAWDT